MLEAFREMRLGIEQRAAMIPPPPAEFRLLVEGLLREARFGAIVSMPLDETQYVRVGTRWNRDQVVVCSRATGRRCSGCGCDYDDRTYACLTCNSRFSYRAWAARQAAA